MFMSWIGLRSTSDYKKFLFFVHEEKREAEVGELDLLRAGREGGLANTAMNRWWLFT